MIQVSRPDIITALEGIRNSLTNANEIAADWDGPLCMNHPIESYEKEIVSEYIRLAFTQTLVLLEVVGLLQVRDSVYKLQEEAEKNYSDFGYFDGVYLTWSSKLGQYIDSIENAFGVKKTRSVTKDLIQILRDTLYAITDSACFSAPPANESEVHTRIEAVLRCLFKDLRTKPPISKPIKNFEPDTGIPSQRTLIEYKYISTLNELKRISDEVLADTRGYTSKDWDTFIYVIYETKRIRKEEEWQLHLRECGVKDDTMVIVLPGESPNSPKKKTIRNRTSA